MTDRLSWFDTFKSISPENKTTEKEQEVVEDKKDDKKDDTVITDKGVTDVNELDEQAKLDAEKKKEEENKGNDTTQVTNVDDVTGTFTPFLTHLTEKNILIPSDKKYEDTEDGFAEAIKDTATHKAKEIIDALPEDAKRLVEMAKEGVDIREVFTMEQQVEDLKDINLENEENLYNMIIDHLILNGYEEAEAVETADGYKDAGAKTLEKHGKIAHKSLLKKQEEKIALKIETDKAKVKAAELAKKKEFEDFKKEVLSTEKLGSFELSKKDREELLDYLTKPVKDGKTKSQLDDTKENRLLLSYFRMKGFDMKSIEKKVETKQATKLKEALGRFTDSNAKVDANKPAPREEKKQTLKLPSFLGM